ncbi:MAG: hypothetical protein EAZ53_08850 [Bacteroidetes bacterium]|nr:MAG: hypothetical protein EAZ53_08850 [Bacteroidota bacterium]
MTDKEYLFKELKDLLSACEVLKYSFEKTKPLLKKEDYSPDEANDIESFTSRFARISDMLVQKTLRMIYEIELDKVDSVRDRIMKAEKMDLNKSASDLIEIRKLRNEIAHDYAGKRFEELFKLASVYCETIFDIVERIENYILKKYL